MKRILDIKNLQVNFKTYAGTVYAVRDISFYLNQGETLAIVGESGCGKTATSKTILRLLPKYISDIANGSIDFNGKDLVKLSEKEMNKVRGGEIAMIFQDPMTSLNPTMKVGEQIMESLILHKRLSKSEARKEAIEMMKLVNIPQAEMRMEAYPHEFSGGMRQRVMIAIALSCGPKILIADEPTTALDVTIQAQIMFLMKKLQSEMDTAIILVTHDLGVVAGVADRIQVMYAGEIVETGTTVDIFKNPSHPYTVALLKSIPATNSKNKSELYSIKGTPPDLIAPPKGCGFAYRCEHRMEICMQMRPQDFDLGNGHLCKCWLEHPYAKEGRE